MDVRDGAMVFGPPSGAGPACGPFFGPIGTSWFPYTIRGIAMGPALNRLNMIPGDDLARYTEGK